MKATTTLTAEEIDQQIVLVRNHWPDVYHYETGVFNLALNRVQAIAEKDGVAAITPLRLEGGLSRKVSVGYSAASSASAHTKHSVVNK